MLNNLRQINKIVTFVHYARHLQLNKKWRVPITVNIRNYCAHTVHKHDEETKELKTNLTNPFVKPKSSSQEETLNVVEEPGSSNANETAEENGESEVRLKVLKLEADIAHQEGRRVPSLDFFQDYHWNHVLTLPSKSARIKYYSFLWQIQMKKDAKARKKVDRAESTIQHKEELRRQRDENTHIIYGLGHTSLFLRIYDSTINHWQNNRLTRAMQFSPKIVLDCSYDKHMTHREALNAAKQLMLCFAENRAHDDPFDLHYCNVDMKSTCMQSLQRYIPTMLNPEFPMNVSAKCFTETFPKEQLVYLTPHCRTELQAYNADDVYIIGAMVDTVNNEPLSLAKAKKMGLRMARLPLDHYLQWGAGSGKSLTLNQMINILLDLKMTGDWHKALEHVPRRKIADAEHEVDFQRNALYQRAGKLNMRIDKLMDDKEEYYQKTTQPHKVRSYKQNSEFNLNTWASKKKSRSENS